MTQKAITPITDGQKKQYLRFVEDAAGRALAEVDPDKEGLQKLIMNGGEFQARIRAAVREFSVNSEFANEEVESSRVYPYGYHGARPIADQLSLLYSIFPRLGFVNEKRVKQPLPSIAEGYFAIPCWEALAKTYGEAIELVFTKIKETRKAYTYRDQFGARHLRQSARSIRMWQKFAKRQKEDGLPVDILVVPAQFGLRHRGKSVRRAREVFKTSEFGLGGFATGIMLLTHPERLVDIEDLGVDCAGDEFDAKADGSFAYTPRWHISEKHGLVYSALQVESYDSDYGSVSAVLLETV